MNSQETTKYTCGYCGKEYNTLGERSDCECKCRKEQEEANRKDQISHLKDKLCLLQEEENEQLNRLRDIQQSIRDTKRQIALHETECTTYQINGEKVNESDFFKAMNKAFGSPWMSIF